MAWWGGKDRRIQQLLNHLEQGSRVPARAVRFHRLRDSFWRDLLRFQKRRLPRPGRADEAESLLRRGKDLEKMAEGLEDLMRQADDLGQRLGEIERRAAQFENLGPAVCQRCEDWRIELARLGSMTGRAPELELDRRRLQQIEWEHGLHNEALHLFSEARRQADAMEEEDRHSFVSRLHAKQLEMGRGPVDRAWLDDLRQWLEVRPSRPQEPASPPIVPPPEPPPPEPSVVEDEREQLEAGPGEGEMPELPEGEWPVTDMPVPTLEGPNQELHELEADSISAGEAEAASEVASNDSPDASRAAVPAAEPAGSAPIPGGSGFRLDQAERAPTGSEETTGVDAAPIEPGIQEEQKERAADLLDEARVWLRELGDGPEKLQQLQQRFGKTPVHWEAWEGPQSLEFLQAVEQLVEGLRERASFMRREKRQFLEEYVGEYRRLLGSDEGLQADLRQLNRLSADSPERHARWLGVAEEAESRFRGTAALHQDRLQESVADHLKSLQNEVEAFGRRPLFSEDLERLQEIGQRLDSVGELDNLDSLLAALLEGRRLERDLEGLRSGAEENRTRLEQQKASLLARDQELSRAAAVAEMPIQSLQGPIGKLHGEATEELGSLSESDRHIQGISSRLDEQQRELAEACREQLETHSEQCRQVASSLQPLPGTPAAEEFEVGFPSSDDLEPLLQSLQVARQVRDRAEAALQQAIEQLEQRRQEIRDDLQALPGSVPYGRNRRSRHLRGLFHDDLFRDAQDDPLLLLAKLRKAVERGEAFRDSFYRNQRRVREYRRSLPRRLTEFEARGLQRFAPRPVLDRVTALIEGVSEQPDDWANAVLQLQEAEALLTRLERHARRLEASPHSR